MYRILLALDPSSALAGRTVLEQDGYTVVVASPADVFDALLRDEFAVVITSLDGADLSAIPFSRRVDGSRSSAEFLVAVSDVESGRTAVKEGAFDFITLPIDPEDFRLTIRHALEHHRLRAELSAARALLRERFSPARWLGASSLSHLRAEVAAILPGRDPILVVGEPGTETATLAHLIHFWSHRSAGPFLPIPGSIFLARELEAALRGVARSEISPRHRSGLFERAHGGTLFFEEISRIPHEIQEWLASVIETGTALPQGAAAPIRADVRVICAIHQDPEVAVANHRLDPGLFERLRHRVIVVPPLRERSDQIEALASQFLESCGAGGVSVTPAALQWLRERRWPGNRMELEATLLRGLLDRASPDRVSLADLVPGEADPSESTAETRTPGASETSTADTASAHAAEAMRITRTPDAHEESGAMRITPAHNADEEPQAMRITPAHNADEEPQAMRMTDPSRGDEEQERSSRMDPPHSNGESASRSSYGERPEEARSSEHRNGPVRHIAPAPHSEPAHAHAHRSGSNGDSEEGSHGELHLPGNGVDLVLLERQLIEEALERTEGNQTQAARLLGLTRQTLIYRMQKYGIR